EAMAGGAIAPIVPMVCTGPIRYCGETAVKRDMENLKAAVKAFETREMFMSSIAPGGVGSNEFYRSEEEFFDALGAALRIEYKTIVDGGLVLQMDDPYLTDIFDQPSLDHYQRDRRVSMFVEGINESMR